MTPESKGKQPVFQPGGASRLLENSGDMTADERALLLALIGVDAEVGRGLGDKERGALDELKAQVEGYDADELTQAVKHMVKAEPRDSQQLEWPDLKRGRSKRSSTE